MLLYFIGLKFFEELINYGGIEVRGEIRYKVFRMVLYFSGS